MTLWAHWILNYSDTILPHKLSKWMKLEARLMVNIMNYREMKYNVDYYIIIRFYIDILILVFIIMYLLKCKVI